MKKQLKIVGKHMLLALLAFIWLIPIVWLLVTSFSSYKGINTMHFFPQRWSLDNYMQLFFRPDTVANFPAWFRNSLIIGAATCVISTLFVLMVAYAMSCMRFPARKPLMSIAIILGMFPGVLSMIAIYFVMKLLGLTDSMAGLIIIYSAGSGLGYLICKGFFDTISVSLRESANWRGIGTFHFRKIVIPIVETDRCLYGDKCFPESVDGFCDGKTYDPFKKSGRLDGSNGYIIWCREPLWEIIFPYFVRVV